MNNAAEAETLDSLMSRDPLELSAQDITTIVAYLRKHRSEVEAKTAAIKAAPSQLKLSDLDIKL